MAGPFRSISVKLSAQIAEYVTNMRQAGQATVAFGGELQTLSQTSKSKFNDVLKFSTAAGVGMLAFAGFAEKASLAFDKQMSEVQAVSGASAKQFGQLREAAIQAGKDTIYSATEAAQGEAELAKAGLSVSQILGGGLKGALSLASAGQVSLGDAATDTAQALNMFGLGGQAASHVADVLSAGANASATDVDHMAYSLKQAGLVSSQLGLSLEDTAGVLADFAQNGLVGSDAGTSFKVMLQALQSPSEKTKSLMRELGISLYDQQGRFVGITNLAQNLHDKLSGLTQAQRDNALSQIFGSDAVRSATILYEQGAAGVQKWINAVDDSGNASRTAATKLDNLAGDAEQLKGSLETLAIAASGGVNSGLRILTQGATGLVNVLIGLPPPVTEAATLISGIGGILTLGATGFVKAKAASKEFLDTLAGMGPAGEKAAEKLGKIGSVLGKASLWGAGALLAYAGFKALTDWIDRSTGPVVRDVDQLTNALKELGSTGRITGELAKTFGPNLSGLTKDLSTLASAQVQLGDITRARRQAAAATGFDAYNQRSALRYSGVRVAQVQRLQAQPNEDFKDTDTALANLVNGGQITLAADSFQKLIAPMRLAGYSLNYINGLFPQYAAATQAAVLANGAASKGFAGTAAQMALLNGDLQGAINTLGSLDAAFKALNGANIDAAQAAITFQADLGSLAKALQGTDKQLEHHKRSLDITTAAGQQNETMVIGLIKDAEAHAQAILDQTGSVDKASAAYDQYIGQLRGVLKQAGFTDQQIKYLIDTFGKMPPAKAVPISAPGADSVIGKLKTIYDTIEHLPNGKTFTLHVDEIHTSNTSSLLGRSINRWGGVYTHAADGLLNQAGYYPAVNPGRYMIAEPQTGGEAFVPRFGDYWRSTAILDYAARWYGGRFAPNAGQRWMGGGASTTSNVNYNVYPQRANFTVGDLRALVAEHNALVRSGRRR